MVKMESTSCDEDDAKLQKKFKMGSTILDCFTKLISDKPNIRLEGGNALIRYLYQQKKDDEGKKEVDYSLKRLIRGLGASKITSRKGFYTTLTAYFKFNQDINVNDVLQIMDTELKSSGSNSKSENADIFMGRILLCGALIRSKLLNNQEAEVHRRITEVVLEAGKKRSYLSFISMSFLIEFIFDMDETTLKSNIWPLLSQELGKSWEEQTLDTFYILLVMSDKFPSLVSKKFLTVHLGTSKIIDIEYMDKLLKLITDIPRVVCCRHPLYKIFSEKLVNSGYVKEFWTGIDEKFLKPSRNMEHLSLELLNLILKNIKDKNIIPSLLSPNFVQHMLKRFNSCKRNRKDDVALLFRQSLTQLVSVLNDENIKPKVQIDVLKKLILYPGDLMFEKITSTKVIQLITLNMTTNGVKKLSKFYREIVSNSKPKEIKGKEETWTNAERTYASQLLSKLLGHSAVNLEHEWRLEQLKFLFNLGFCETSNVSVELAPQFKESFYRALDHKLPKLNDLRNILNELIRHINKELFVSKTTTLRTALSESATEAWEKMINFITKLDKDPGNKEAILIFYTMDVHMALQLFSDPEMAVSSINEIHSCSERLAKKKPTKKNKKLKTEVEKIEDEPEWVEVIVDLLLSLLSKHSHLLRSLVKCVFPHVCPLLTASAVHQILSVLDPKDDKGPLVPVGAEENDSSSESNSDSEEESNDKDDENMADNNGSESEMDVDDDDDDEDENEDDEEDETVTDKLRLAVRQALGDASAQTDDEDINVDDIGEEEGKRLDEALAAAFRILRENRTSNKKKQGKSAEALTHFRVRVIDLLEIYIDSGPSMALALDMLVPLFALLEFCIKDPHQKPLENRVRTCLKKLSAVKKFKDTEGVDEKLLKDLATALIEKGERSTSVCQEMGDKLAECCTFLVRCVQQTNLPSDGLIQMFIENLNAFFKKRDCVLPASLFKNILQLPWNGNLQLVPLLIDFAFDNSIRSFRRGQALEFLTIFYRKSRMINEIQTNLRKKMEKKLSSNTINLLNELSHHNRVNGEVGIVQNGISNGKEVRQKFLCLLWTLLHAIYPNHIPKAWNWKDIGDAMAEYRKKNSLSKDAKTAYNKLAVQIGAPRNITTQVKIPENIPTMNGIHSEEKEEEEEEEEKENENENETRTRNGNAAPDVSSQKESDDEEMETSNKMRKKELAKKSKNRSKQGDRQKLKKEARELRMKAMSEGLGSGINFSSVVLDE